MNTHRIFTSTLLPTVALVAACILAPGNASASPRRAISEPPAGPLPFVQDDYAGALELSRAQKVPLFMDFWAPW